MPVMSTNGPSSPSSDVNLPRSTISVSAGTEIPFSRFTSLIGFP